MANRERKEPEYKIVKTSYTYKKTDDVDENGRPVFVQIGEPKESVCRGVKNFKELKLSLNEQKNKDSSLKINYERANNFTCYKDKFGRVTNVRRHPTKIKNTVKHNSDGEYVVTYFNAKSKK